MPAKREYQMVSLNRRLQKLGVSGSIPTALLLGSRAEANLAAEAPMPGPLWRACIIGSGGSAFAVNDRGQVVGIDAADIEGFVWSSSTDKVPLGTLGGHPRKECKT